MYYVYIMSNTYHSVFYIGVTNNLERRIAEHKSWEKPWFTQKYHITTLLYFEDSQSRNDAILREKQLKWRSRNKKIQLIKTINSSMQDLS